MKMSSKKPLVLSALALAGLFLAGCGGGTGSTPQASASLAGTVVDGYIQGANVCLDLNANLTCDSNEPKAVTAKDGSYKLDTSGLTANQLKTAHLLTEVPDTAKDQDDGGLTLKEAGKKAFNLLAPAAAYLGTEGTAVTGAIISPLTTLVAHDMIVSQTPLATAETNVRARLGLNPDINLRQDFVAQKDSTLMTKAQMLTVALGNVKAQALADKVAQDDKQALLAALQYLQTQATELQAAFDDAKKANASAKPVDLVKTALATESAKPVVAELVAEAKKTTDSSAASVVSLIEQGIYSAHYVLEAACTVCTRTPEYWQVVGTGGKITKDLNYILKNGAWTPDTTSTSTGFTLTVTGWVSSDQSACSAGQSITYSADTSGVTTVNFCNGLSERFTARKVDAGGKTLQDLGLNPPSAYAKTQMPAGSELYWFEFANTEDEYQIFTGAGPVSSWTAAGNTKFTSLDQYMKAYRTPSNGSVLNAGWSGLYYSFDAGGSATGGTVTLWSPSWQASTNQAVTSKIIGKADYSIRTVYGQQVLIIHAQPPQNDKGDLLMFAVKDGLLYGGSYRSASIKGIGEPLFNITMLNAILKAGNKPAALM